MSEANCKQPPWRFFNNTNGWVDGLIPINRTLVKMFHLTLRGKGIFQNFLVVISYELTLGLIVVRSLGLLFGKKYVILCA